MLFIAVFAVLARAERTRGTWVLAGVFTGLAMASKFNMVVLPAFAVAMLLLERGFPIETGERKPRFPWGGIGLAAVCALAALALCYRVSLFPLYWKGLFATIERLGQGRSSFFLGSYSVSGFWLYFPAALLVKTPLALLAAAVATALWWGKNLDRGRAWVLAPAAAYFLLSLTSKVQIGIRHLLPLYPFLVLAAGCGAGLLWDRGGRARLLSGGLALWAAVSVGLSQPHLLAYFNEIAGGPRGGIDWFVDSNSDWGQDLKGLGRGLKEMGAPSVYLSYFGTADPSAYGIRYVPLVYNWNVQREGDDVDPAAEGRVLFAVSATTRKGVYSSDHGIFDWLDSREPIATYGHTIELFDLTEDRGGREELADLFRRTRHARAPGLVRSLLSQ